MQYIRSYKVEIGNPLVGQKYVKFYTENVNETGVDTILTDAGSITENFTESNALEKFYLYDSNGNTTAELSYMDVYNILSQLYVYILGKQ